MAEANKKELKMRQKRLELKQRNEALLDRVMSTQGAFNRLAGKKKKEGEEADAVDLGIAANSMKRFFNKMPAEGLVGDYDKK
mmetsp:Transcript_25451/g.31819  ORF Transcript_25451/g.31819 Transcript_25451/m.31819 type:complete len:82 (+) Transcript_25451:76-321(+)